MKRRGLLYVENLEELKYAKKYVDDLHKCADIDIELLYVKDILKYDVLPTALDIATINLNIDIALKEFAKMEKENAIKIEEEAKEKFDKIMIKEGVTEDEILETLKNYDLLFIVNLDKVKNITKFLLKHSYKPLVVINKQDTYNFEKILLLDDGGFKSNRSMFLFSYLFELDKIDILRVNPEENLEYPSVPELKVNKIEKEGDILKNILSTSEDYDVLIMGDLKYITTIEKISKKVGMRILEKTNKTLFIS